MDRVFPRRLTCWGGFLTLGYCSRTVGYCFIYCFLEIFVGNKALMKRDKIVIEGIPQYPQLGKIMMDALVSGQSPLNILSPSKKFIPDLHRRTINELDFNVSELCSQILNFISHNINIVITWSSNRLKTCYYLLLLLYC